jgi:ferredoxin-NADP reductase
MERHPREEHRMTTAAESTATVVDTTLRKATQVATGTMAFHLEKPAGFAFKPGQAIDLVLPSNGDKHAFSLVTAPFEDELVVATRMRPSAYKAELARLRPGARLGIEGPFGSLTLHRAAKRDAVFVAGGIGITPFMSILRQAAHDRDARRFVLLYSNRRPEDAAFLSELQQLARDFPRLTLVATMTEAAAGTWNGLARMIDPAMIRDATRDLASPVCYVAGPPAMIAAMQAALPEAGIDPDDIRGEEFFGY